MCGSDYRYQAYNRSFGPAPPRNPTLGWHPDRLMKAKGGCVDLTIDTMHITDPSGQHPPRNPKLGWHPARLMKAKRGCVDLSLDTMHITDPSISPVPPEEP